MSDLLAPISHELHTQMLRGELSPEDGSIAWQFIIDPHRDTEDGPLDKMNMLTYSGATALTAFLGVTQAHLYTFEGKYGPFSVGRPPRQRIFARTSSESSPVPVFIWTKLLPEVHGLDSYARGLLGTVHPEILSACGLSKQIVDRLRSPD